MRTSRRSRSVLLAAAGSLAFAASAAAQGQPGQQGPPPPPTATDGRQVQTVATGVPTPTAFAFAGSTVFAGSGPSEQRRAPTGLFVLAGGKATKVPGTPRYVFGLAWRSGTLYVSSGPRIVAYRGWTGTRFSRSRTVSRGRGGRAFSGFNGLAIGPNGRLYAGLSLDPRYDGKVDPNPFSKAVVSMRRDGSDLRIVARGLRQPFQMTFPTGARNPFVTNLAEDKGRIPPDQIVVARPGQNYGNPVCTWLVLRRCRGFDRPRILIRTPHASPMGIGAIGRTLYVALFGGLGEGPTVVTIPARGGTPTPLLTGFAAPVIGLAINNRDLYVGDLTGTIYKVTV